MIFFHLSWLNTLLDVLNDTLKCPRWPDLREENQDHLLVVHGEHCFWPAAVYFQAAANLAAIQFGDDEWNLWQENLYGSLLCYS